MTPNEPISFAQTKLVYKAWGYERHIWNGPLYCGKMLVFNQDAAFSLHWHHLKTETWYVLSGVLILTYFDLTIGEEKTKTLVAGDVIHVPAGNPHRLRALQLSEIVEFSTTDHSWDNYRISPSQAAKI